MPSKEVVPSKFLFLNDTLGYMAALARMPQADRYATSIWRTIDGGTIWQEEELHQEFYTAINDLKIYDSTIYATGGYGVLLKKELGYTTSPGPTAPPITSLEDTVGDDIFLYPVPSSHTLTLAAKRQLNRGKVRLYNSTGHPITSYDILGNTKDLQLDISNLSPGLYFLELQTNTQRRQYKFIKN